MGKNKNIKAFGEVMMRLEVPNYLKLDQSRELKVLYTGTGVNVLSALRKYGYNTSIITKLPDNSIGDAAFAYIGSLGIATSDIIRGGEYLGMYFLEKGFDIRPSKVTYSNRMESSFCTSTVNEYDLDNILKDTTMIHLCGITLSISDQTRNNILQIAEKAKELGITVAFDFNFRPKLWHNYEQARSYYEAMLQFVDICFMTERDAQYILQMQTDKFDQQEQIEDLIPGVAKKYNIQVIAGTMRKNARDEKQSIGGYLYQYNSFFYSQNYHHASLERIGTGDAFSSGIMHGIITNLTPEETVEFSTAACALAHTTYGDSPICSDEEVWSFVNQNEERIER